MREIKININKENKSWALYVKGYVLGEFIKNDETKAFFNRYFIAESFIRDNKIIFLGECCFDDEWLETAKDGEMFNEICEFIHEDLKGNLVSKFQGSFIDALKYIKENFKR